MVFAKAPVPGYAKTRLASVIGDEGAARLAARMITEAMQQAVDAVAGPVTLWCAPDETHPVFVQAGSRHDIRLARQSQGDLGMRMCGAMAQALQGHERALIIGTDIPDLDASRIRRAAEDLRSHDAVFIPATDGGYVLIGLSRMIPELFDGIEWGTPRVMEQTRHKLSGLGVRWIEYDALNDVDGPEELKFVPSRWLA